MSISKEKKSAIRQYLLEKIDQRQPAAVKKTAEAFGVTRTRRGTVETAPDQYASSVDGVFTAGDMHRGQSLVVWAVCEGRNCAREVDEYLMGYTVK